MIKNLSYLTFLTILASCGLEKAPKSPKKLELVNSAIISIRGNSEVDPYMVRLKGKALLERAETVNGEILINEEDKLSIIAEQDEFLRAAQSISSEIQVLYSTKLVMNSLTIVAPPHVMRQINSLPMVQNSRPTTIFAAPVLPMDVSASVAAVNARKSLAEFNSTAFIGAQEAHKTYGVTGKDLKIAIIDTGIDYTHSMLGGGGDAADFASINPNEETPLFPNQKVIGGIDLVGDEYSPSSPYRLARIPRPDKNPLDFNGHGTHVAGTAAGIGDGVKSYNGTAPDALLYAVKVFGRNSTSDAVVIAGLEFCVDPNGDLDPSDRVDVINLSLGSPYGKPSINYTEAIKNTVSAGISVVAAAGNSGNNPFIVGAPSTTPEAFSVAAGIDNMAHNVELQGSLVVFDETQKIMLSPYASFSKILGPNDSISGKIVVAGTATEAFSEEMLQTIKGNIALIDRGVNAFTEKVQFAIDAGAIGVVLANNAAGDPIIAGGSEVPVSIPVVMISLSDAQLLKNSTEAVFAFSKNHPFERPELIDTVTDFSSRGPRSIDGLIKPEIVAPGQQIISAATKTGSNVSRLNGTSMASPHMAGVMALMKQRFPNLSVTDHKILLMTSAKTIHDAKGIRYPVSAQGAGRVDVMKALDSRILASRGAFSLGKLDLKGSQTITEKLKLTNVSNEELVFQVSGDFSGGLSVTATAFKIQPEETIEVDIEFNLNPSKSLHSNFEGFLKLATNSGELIATFPVLAVIHESSQVTADVEPLEDDLILVNVNNNSPMKGKVLPFYLLGFDDKKPDLGPLSHIRSNACDLQSAGFRFIEKQVGETSAIFLQVGVKLYEAVTNWEACEVSIQIDQDGDDKADIEWVATRNTNLPGLAQAVPAGFYSILLNANSARNLRSDFERLQRDALGRSPVLEDYRSAVIDLQAYTPFQLSSVTVMEIALDRLNLQGSDLKLKLAVLDASSGSAEGDDYLGSEWLSVAYPKKADDWPEVIDVDGAKSISLELSQSQAIPLIFYTPTNSIENQEIQTAR